MNTMAFISTVPLKGRTVFASTILPVCSGRPVATATATVRMSIDGSTIANGLKLALATGVVVTAATFLLGSQAEASIFNFRGERPSDLGVQYGRYLNTCPSSPNCISSSANAYDSHYVPNWTYNNGEAKKPKKSMQEAIADVKKVLEETPRVTIIDSKPINSEFGEGYYIYSEFQSKLMGFVDDVEFYFRPDEATVEYRSASRLGEKDFNANRNRIRDLRVALQEIDNRWASTGY